LAFVTTELKLSSRKKTGDVFHQDIPHVLLVYVP
jgi:hypothetical protein